jgi:hypothetical protein
MSSGVVLQSLLFRTHNVVRRSSVLPRWAKWFQTFLRLGRMACVRYLFDAGWMCRSSVAGDQLLPASSLLSIQGSCLSIGVSLLMGHTLAVTAQLARASVYVSLQLMMRLTGCFRALRLAQMRWPSFSHYVRYFARHTAWVFATAIGGAMSLVSVTLFTRKSVVDMDGLTQKAQRLHLPFSLVCLRYCLYAWLPAKFQKNKLDREYWCWQVPGDVDVPLELCCPITWQLLSQPVLLHGDVFECKALMTWLRQKPRHPLRADVAACSDEVQPASDLGKLCCAFAEKHGAQAVRA